jgi:hypothetical protein
MHRSRMASTQSNDQARSLRDAQQDTTAKRLDQERLIFGEDPKASCPRRFLQVRLRQ